MTNILLFGASGGIATSLIEYLNSEFGDRYSIFSVTRSEEKAEDLKRLSKEVYVSDYSEESLQEIFQKLTEKQINIQGIVNFAGSLLLKPIHLTSFEEFKTVIDVNLNTSFLILKYGIKHILSHNQGGSLVLCSSAVSEIGLQNHEAIAAAKGAIAALAKSCAATYANKNIRVNCVAPGLTKTQLTKRITSSETAVSASLALHPLKRLGEPIDVARAIEFLLNPENSWITGQILGVDGGLSSLK